MDRATGDARNSVLDTSSSAYDEKPKRLSTESVPSGNMEVASHAEKEWNSTPDEEDHEETNEAVLELTPSTHAHASDASSIPNGGLRAWLQVLGSFFLLFNSWGILNTFGSYQAYYETSFLSHTNPSTIAWVGSIQASLLLLVGVLAGPLYDAGYFREMLIFGSFFLVLGQMMLSLCQTYWQVLLAQAFCIGIGCGALFTPSVAILSTYFSTKVGLVLGIAASGSSFGGIIYPIVFHKLLPKLGFAWTTRVLGFLMLGTLIIPNTVMRVRVLPAQKRKLLDLKAFLIPAYSLQVCGFFCGFMGLYMPFFYAQVYALECHITSENLAFYLLAVMNSVSIFGRILPNMFSDKIGPINVVIPCCLVSGILCICFIAVKSSAGIIVLMAFYGFFSGSFVSLPATVVVYLSQDAREKIGTRLGMSFGIVSIGALIGTPIGGAILDHSGFNGLWIYGACMLFASGLFLALARVTFVGWGLVKA